MNLNLERFVNLKTNLRSKVQTVTSKMALHRMSSFIFLSILLPVIISPNASLIRTDRVEAKTNVIKLSVDSPTILVSGNKISEIKPGESQEDKKAREKSEAEAKAAADAQAKTKSASSRSVVARENRVYNDPSDFTSIYQRAEAAYGVDARILRAVHLVETGGSGSSGITNHGGSGAQGPMQFMPSTWRRHGVDGNGDGIVDINNVEDAIFSAAAYLKACGYPNVQKALWGYNPSTAYYNKIMGIARSLGY